MSLYSFNYRWRRGRDANFHFFITSPNVHGFLDVNTNLHLHLSLSGGRAAPWACSHSARAIAELVRQCGPSLVPARMIVALRVWNEG